MAKKSYAYLQTPEVRAKRAAAIKAAFARKKKNKNLPAVFQPGEIPLDLIPDRPNTTVRPRIGHEGPLILLFHRVMDHQERMLELFLRTRQNKAGKGKKHA